MADTLPGLILTSGPYLGREMKDPAVMSRRMLREGHVDIGTPRVVN